MKWIVSNMQGGETRASGGEKKIGGFKKKKHFLKLGYRLGLGRPDLVPMTFSCILPKKDRIRIAEVREGSGEGY